MTGLHTDKECTQKLVALLDKVKELRATDITYNHTALADIKALARELERESEFVSGIR